MKMHRKIYSKTALKKTADAFAEAADISISKDGDYHVVDIRKKSQADIPAKDIASEFANYAIYASRGY